jgi:fatty acid desaturase
MSSKLKQVPGNARPHTTQQKLLPARGRREFRTARPHFFAFRLFLMATLCAAFGVGVVSTDPPVKQAIAALAALTPFLCGVEALSRGRLGLRSLARFLAFGVIGLLLLSAALYAPTVLCQFAIGALLAHGTELAHQALHKAGTGRAPYDTPIGLVLCGVTFVSFYFYLWSHLRHHRYNGTEKDRESFSYAYDLIDSPSRLWRFLGFVWHLTLAGHYVTAVRRMALAVVWRLRGHLRAAYPEMSERVAAKVEREYQVQALVVLAVGVASVAFQTTLLLDLWLVPVFIGWGPAHSLIETTEHWHCDVPNPDVFRNTRSLRAGLFARWYTNYNSCHVGHHHDMSVPADRLPSYEAELAASNEFRHLEESYPAFYGRFLWHLWAGRPPAKGEAGSRVE